MAYTDREDLNYIGVLYEIGANQTPFLNAIGGLNSGKTAKSFLFPVAQPYNLSAASQPAITEAVSVSSNTATTVTRGQDINTVQIWQYTVEVSKAKQSTTGEIGGISVLGDQPVKDEFDFQKMAQFRQFAVDLDYTFLNGEYQASTSSLPAKTKGMINAITSNTVDADGAAVSKALVDSVLAKMALKGAPFENVVMVMSAFQKQGISKIYGYAPEDRNVGGVNIKQIETDFGLVGVMFDPHVATDDIIFAEMTVCSPMYVPTDGKLIVFEDLAKVAASRKGQWYAQVGLDFGPEEYHGSLTNLSVA